MNMQLKKYKDYALRVLIFTGMKYDVELASIIEISDVFSISQHYLEKFVFELNKLYLLVSISVRYGGIRLAKRTDEINVGALVRKLENDFDLLECFDPNKNHCVISPACRLKNILHEALEAFLHVLDQYT